MAEFDLSTMGVSEMKELRIAIEKEIRDREVIANAEVEVEKIANRYLKAAGREEGTEWVQPTGAHNAYPAGYVITHLGKEWRSLVRGNVWEPGVSAWREVVPPGTAPPEWVQPTGAHDAYAEHDRVTFDGAVWISLSNGNVWSPHVAPSQWMPEDPKYYEPEPEVPVEPEEPEEPVEPDPPIEEEEPPPTETVPDFVQPTGAHNAYAIGDKVTFNGNVYQSLIAANTYSPSAYPAGWEQIS